MRRWNGYVLALVGFLILVGSLLVSSPFSGHSEGKRVRERGVVAPPAWAPAGAPAAVVPPAASAPAHGVPLQESGPIVYRGEELEAHLSFPVPVGKRFVIETVSVRATLGSGARSTVMFTATAGGASATHVVPLEFQGPFPNQGDVLAGARSLRVYADGGTVVYFRVDRSAARESDTGFITISGNLE
ncbi:MAG TPA: hypothetical protein VJB14_06740 [Planctomycetota bacterium]|nr:hypothetical protein [Planctomycetota bacterium]